MLASIANLKLVLSEVEVSEMRNRQSKIEVACSTINYALSLFLDLAI